LRGRWHGKAVTDEVEASSDETNAFRKGKGRQNAALNVVLLFGNNKTIWLTSNQIIANEGVTVLNYLSEN
jgi:hypothetical protein